MTDSFVPLIYCSFRIIEIMKTSIDFSPISNRHEEHDGSLRAKRGYSDVHIWLEGDSHAARRSLPFPGAAKRISEV